MLTRFSIPAVGAAAAVLIAAGAVFIGYRGFSAGTGGAAAASFSENEMSVRAKGGEEPGGTQIKGGASETAAATAAAHVDAMLDVYLKTAPQSAGETLTEGTTLHEGDTIQLAYTAFSRGIPSQPDGTRVTTADTTETADAASVYGIIFSIDGRGTLTLHYPYTENGNTRLATGRRTVLSEAYTLDDAPLYEVFFLVVDEAPPDTAGLLDRARRFAGGLSRPVSAEALARDGSGLFTGYDVETLVIYKEETL